MINVCVTQECIALSLCGHNYFGRFLAPLQEVGGNAAQARHQEKGGGHHEGGGVALRGLEHGPGQRRPQYGRPPAEHGHQPEGTEAEGLSV